MMVSLKLNSLLFYRDDVVEKNEIIGDKNQHDNSENSKTNVNCFLAQCFFSIFVNINICFDCCRVLDIMIHYHHHHHKDHFHHHQQQQHQQQQQL
jgi:hypothetical protein